MNLRAERQLRDELSKVWSMLEVERSASKWQPIETAPKNGNHILLYRYDIKFVGYYGGANVGWRINAPDLPCMWPEPTHWMPLPKPPIETPKTSLSDAVRSARGGDAPVPKRGFA